MFHNCLGEAVSFITQFSYHLVNVNIFQLIQEIKTTSLAVAFHSLFNCSIVAIIQGWNNAHSPVVIVVVVETEDKSEVKVE